jgi:hypothetical protein
MATSFKQGLGSPIDDFLASIAVSAEQIALVAHPERRLGAARSRAPAAERPDHPYLVWKDDLDLARRVNDSLCRER